MVCIDLAKVLPKEPSVLAQQSARKCSWLIFWNSLAVSKKNKRVYHQFFIFIPDRNLASNYCKIGYPVSIKHKNSLNWISKYLYFFTCYINSVNYKIKAISEKMIHFSFPCALEKISSKSDLGTTPHLNDKSKKSTANLTL